MDLRMQLVTEYMKGDESVAALSRRFDISRKTVYNGSGATKKMDRLGLRSEAARLARIAALRQTRS